MQDMLGKLIRLILTVPLEYFGTLVDLVEKITGPEGVQWIEELKKFLRKEATWVKIAYTRLISGKEILTLDPTDGTAIIADAKDVFKAGIDADFVNWKCNVPSSATLKQDVVVHEIIEDGNFAQIFTGLDANLENLCLTQAQIIQFVSKHRKWLRTEGHSTFFLFKVGTEFFVVNVHVYSYGRLHVHLDRFSDAYVWRARYRLRIVIPETLI